MANITVEDRQRVKDSVNIVDVINQFVSLKKQGKNYFGFCPFHDERTPSFSVTAQKQLFKCFSCGRSGDVFSFFIEKEGLTFPESVLRVAQIAQIELDVQIDNNVKVLTPEQKQKQKMIDMHNIAADFYHHILVNTYDGDKALDYLQKRGLTLETIKQFKIGVTLHSRRLLYDVLKKREYSHEDMEQSGLFTHYTDNILDRFYDRIIVPLRNENGDVVALSGRMYLEQKDSSELDEKQPKYLNSPETSIFHKGTFLFNLDLARGFIRKQDKVVLCEGYMDVISVYQSGITNVVASMGTSLTEQQIHLLKKMSKEVVLAYDGDRAGVNATQRAIELLQNQNIAKVSVVPMIDSMDPDEMIQEKGADYFREHFNHEKETVFEFYRRFYKQQFSLTNDKDVLDYVDLLLKQLVYEPSITARSLYINQIADEFNISTKALNEQLTLLLSQVKRTEFKKQVAYEQENQYGSISNVKNSDNKSEKQQVEWLILRRLLTDNQTEMLLFNENSHFHFDTELYQKMLLLYVGMQVEHKGDLQHFSQMIVDEPLRQLYNDAQFEALPTEVTRIEIKDLVNRQQKCRLKEQLSDNSFKIKEAKKANDINLELELLTLRNKLMKQIGEYK